MSIHMSFVFRVDASNKIGTGHVMRCLTLAESLRQRGGDVCFVCRQHDGNLCDLIEQHEFAVHRLPIRSLANDKVDGNSAHAAWLGAHWREDAEETLAAIEASGAMPDWLVVDHYSLGIDWERYLRRAVSRIMVIDDLADRNHDCDLLLDQNLIERQNERYHGKVPDGCTLLLGPSYALLQPEYARLRREVHLRQEPVRRVFVYFGGVDRDDLTLKTVDALLRLGRPEIEADIVLSSDSSQFRRVQERIAEWPGLRLHTQVPSLARFMVAADLAIGASGATNWERLCLGLPALVVTVASNQVPLARSLHSAGLIRWLGDGGEVTAGRMVASIREVDESGLLGHWSSRCMEECDAGGTERVAQQLDMLIHSSKKTGTDMRENCSERLRRHELGFWEVVDKPTPADLETYYASKYYQEARGSYEKSYSEAELLYIKAKIHQRWSVVADRFSGKGRLLDVGCGEGFVLASFDELGWEVRGLDFSRAGVEAQNSAVSDCLLVGDIFELLDQERISGDKYDIVWLQNVLEHVIEPVPLMENLRHLVKPDGFLIVTVPNDFSELQKAALEGGFIDKEFWVVTPDHLSYFDNTSLMAIGNATGWECIEMFGDFPVDWFLFNEAANYISNSAVGKMAHKARVAVENLIASRSVADANRFYSALAHLGMGRNLTGIFSPRPSSA